MIEFLSRCPRPGYIQKILFVFVLLAALTGVFFRVWELKESGFFFYDEGYYLKHNLPVLELTNNHPQMSAADRRKAAYFYFRSALGSGKSFWFFIIDSRFLWGRLFDWTFSKVAACFFGIMTIPLVFFFARRYFCSIPAAFLATGLFALMPGAVFYSRIGLQEALSTFLVLGGFYLYSFPRKMGWQTIVSGCVFALAFFSNYRLIMLPLLLGVYEVWLNGVCRDGTGWRKYVWGMLAFFSCVILGGNLLDGINTQVIAMWVFHQGQEAGSVFSWINLISYPYYLFRLETWPFAAVFLANVYFLLKKRWAECGLFTLVCFQMLFFSFTEEKGARYIAVMYPFAAMSAACFLRHLWRRYSGQRLLVLLFGVFLALGLGWRSYLVASARSDHQRAVDYVLAFDPAGRFLASQEMVESLYVFPHERVRAVPQSFEQLLRLYAQGYRYLVLDPQSYVSLTSDRKFVLPLKDYLGYIDVHSEPIKVFSHMNRALGERFVFEHSENLADSVRFLGSANTASLFSIRVYDLARIVPGLARIYERLKGRP